MKPNRLLSADSTHITYAVAFAVAVAAITAGLSLAFDTPRVWPGTLVAFGTGLLSGLTLFCSGRHQ